MNEEWPNDEHGDEWICEECGQRNHVSQNQCIKCGYVVDEFNDVIWR